MSPVGSSVFSCFACFIATMNFYVFQPKLFSLPSSARLESNYSVFLSPFHFLNATLSTTRRELERLCCLIFIKGIQIIRIAWVRPLPCLFLINFVTPKQTELKTYNSYSALSLAGGIMKIIKRLLLSESAYLEYLSLRLLTS